MEDTLDSIQIVNAVLAAGFRKAAVFVMLQQRRNGTKSKTVANTKRQKVEVRGENRRVCRQIRAFTEDPEPSIRLVGPRTSYTKTNVSWAEF